MFVHDHVKAVIDETRKLRESTTEQIAKSRREFEDVAAHNAQMRASVAESRAVLARYAKRPVYKV